jgi:hypothetical protein
MMGGDSELKARTQGEDCHLTDLVELRGDSRIEERVETALIGANGMDDSAGAGTAVDGGRRRGNQR